MKIIYIFSKITLVICAVVFTSAYIKIANHNKSTNDSLRDFYSNKLNSIYIDGYDVDFEGHLIQSQWQFEKSINDISNEMLEEGFNRQQIDQMKDEARKIGQEARRKWDKLRRSLSSPQTNPCKT